MHALVMEVPSRCRLCMQQDARMIKKTSTMTHWSMTITSFWISISPTVSLSSRTTPSTPTEEGECILQLCLRSGQLS